MAVIEANGATSLVLDGDNFFFNPTAGGSTGPQLRYNNSPVTVGQFAGLTPVAVEQMNGSGYQVVWKIAATNQYATWNTDATGNYVSNGAGGLSSNSYALESLETTFQQDLNGDGTTGPTSTVIEASGGTSLVQVADRYAFGNASGPQLRYGGNAITVGQFAGLTPVAVEQVAGGGYQVVWKIAATNQYATWNVDVTGNYVSNGIGGLSGNSYALESLESTFQQDLNGDGTVGPITTVIEASGATSLVQVADRYAFGNASGPQLRYGGSAITAGQFAGLTPVAVEQMGGGYQVVWKIAATNQYATWNTDANGNYVSNGIGGLSGSSYALESLEATFQQDLNGDGTVGLASTVIEANGGTNLVRVADRYAIGSASGPQLSYAGSPVTVGQFGSTTPIAVEQTAGGYEVIWKNGNQYSGWNTDANGNFLSAAFGSTSGSSYALESLETSFQQDLNGDGTVGLTSTVIEANGPTSLVQVVDRYFLYATGTLTGPQLSYAGNPVTVGQFGSTTPIAVEQTAGGYEVIWRNGSQYSGWNTDANGNFLSAAFGSTSGTSFAVESLETAFHQDLNGDGLLGPTTRVIDANGSTNLVQVADRYFFYPSGGSAGPQFNYNGSPVTVGEFGNWTPIGAEQTANGYQVAWKLNGVDEYTVWNTDANGNYVSGTGVLFGQSSGLEAYEPVMHQDLNSDGTLGVPTSMFNISVNYSGDPNYRFVFDQAAARWEQVVTGVARYPGYYDNVQISASVGPIDGPGRILGQAGPIALVDGVPSAGIMQFDSADLASMYANGTLYYVILHEMGHVLGIGSLWNYDGLTSGSGYFGQNALNAYRLLTGNPYATSVPVETQGGQGTAGVHWSEAAFGNELMTGYIAGAPDPLSIVTVGSLQDLGYRVNYSAADPYNLPGYGSSAVESSSLQANALQGSNGSSGQPIGDVAVLTQSISSTFATSTSAATGITTMIPPPETLLAKPIG